MIITGDVDSIESKLPLPRTAKSGGGTIALARTVVALYRDGRGDQDEFSLRTTSISRASATVTTPRRSRAPRNSPWAGGAVFRGWSREEYELAGRFRIEWKRMDEDRSDAQAWSAARVAHGRSLKLRRGDMCPPAAIAGADLVRRGSHRRGAARCERWMAGRPMTLEQLRPVADGGMRGAAKRPAGRVFTSDSRLMSDHAPG